MSTHARETTKALESALKNNNEWFYDSPSTMDRLESVHRFAAAYFTLAHKWTVLNRAALEAFTLITTQQQTISELESQIAALKENA